jgi:GWxTD domain-containing protein
MRFPAASVIAFLAATLAAMLPADADPPAPAPAVLGVLESALQPGLGRGDFEFHVDAASLRPAVAGRTLVRVLVQLPVRAFLEGTRADRADLRLRVRAHEAHLALAALARAAAEEPDARRDELGRADETLERLLRDFDAVAVAGEAETRSCIEVAARKQLLETDYRLFEMALEIPPGDYVLEVRAENLSRTKRGILDRLRKRPLAAVARLLARVPDLGIEPALGDPTFQVGHGTHVEYAARLFGLLNDSLHVRAWIFGRGRHLVRAVARDRAGEIHWRDSLQVEVAGSAPVGFHTTVNSLPAGQYAVQLEAEGSQGTASVTRSFDVAWALVTWERGRGELDLEAELALREDEFDAFRTLPLGEKESYMEAFWRRRDPTPETATNELRDEFLRRVAFADINYSEGKHGALSDRGRVYVRFGPPEEVQVEAVPSHLAGRGAEEALEKVDDVYTASEHQRVLEDPEHVGSLPEASPAQQAVRQQERRRLIGPANEVLSYELWIYSNVGQPLLPEDRALATAGGIRILFVDLAGHGQYRLRKSSVPLDIPGLGASF